MHLPRRRFAPALVMAALALSSYTATGADLESLTPDSADSAIGPPPAAPIDLKFPPSEAIGGDFLLSAGGACGSCTFSPDGAYVFIETFRTPNPATLKSGFGFHINKVDLATGKIVKDIPESDGWPKNSLKSLLRVEYSYRLAAAGNTLAALEVVRKGDASENKPTMFIPVLFDLNGKPLKALGGKKAAPGNNVYHFGFSGDGRYLAAEISQDYGMSTDKRGCDLYVWDTQSGQVLAGLRAQDMHAEPDCSYGGSPGFTVTPDGKVIILRHDEAHGDKLISYDLNTRSPGPPWGSGWAITEGFTTFSPSGKAAILEAKQNDDGSNDANCAASVPCPRLFSLPDMGGDHVVKSRNGQDFAWFSYMDRGSRQFIWSADESKLLVVGEDGQRKIEYAVVFDVAGNRPLAMYKLPLRGSTFFRLGRTPNGDFLVMGEHPTQPYPRVLRIPAIG